MRRPAYGSLLFHSMRVARRVEENKSSLLDCIFTLGYQKYIVSLPVNPGGAGVRFGLDLLWYRAL